MVDDRSKRDLLFGLLALRSKLVAPDALLFGLREWLAQSRLSLAQVLVERRVLSASDHATLEHSLRSLLRRSDEDVDRGLAEVTLEPSVAGRLADIDHPVIREFLEGHDSRVSGPAAGPGPGGSGPALQRTTRFEALRPHAKGGRGEVHVALDRELQREVAFKQIQARFLDDPDSRQRFQFEAEVTGQLEHPGIVPVYSAGLDAEGNPYYAMRLIQGESLDGAIERYHAAGRPDAERGVLELRRLINHLLVACHAVAYAHSRGVIHRDLKPDNIMVGRFGETFVVDWGLAKHLGDTSDSTVVVRMTPGTSGDVGTTQPGSVAGTPAFMSPEQAAGQLDRLGPASDVYSLGATLYKLLTGRNPFRKGALSEVLERVRRGAFERPRQVDPAIPAPLEAVCLRAMALEPDDRYPTPEALAEDLERWMAGEPVSAWTEPWTVRARRWVTRHQTLVFTSAAAVLVALVGLAAVSAVQARANREMTRVNDQLVTSNEELGRTQGRLREANEDLTRTNLQLTRTNEDLALARDRALARADLAIGAVEEIQAAVEENLDVQNRPDLAGLRRRLLESPQRFYQAFRDDLLADEDTGAQTQRRLVEVYQRLSWLSWNIGSQETAYQSYDETLAVAEELVRRAPEDLEALRLLARIHNDRGVVFTSGMDSERARAEYVEARRLYEQLVEAAPDDVEGLVRLGSTYHNLGLIESRSGRPEEALGVLERGQEVLERALALDPGHRDGRNNLVRIHEVIGTVHATASRPDAAREAFDRALLLAESLVEEAPASLDYRLSLAYVHLRRHDVYMTQGRSDLSLEQVQAALAILRQLESESPSHVEVRVNLAQALQILASLERRTGQVAESTVHLQESLAVLDRLIAEQPENMRYRGQKASCLLSLGSLQYMAGHTDEAIATFEDLVPVLEQQLEEDPEHLERRRSLAGTLYNIAILLAEQGRIDEALDWYDRALEQRRPLAADHPDSPELATDLAYTLANVAMLHQSREEDDLALALLLETCDIQRELLDRHPGVPQLRADLARSLQNLAMVRQALGRHGEAEAGLLEAVELLEPVVAGAASVPQYPWDLAGAYETLGWLHTELRRLDEGERSFERALELADRLCQDFPQDVHHPRLRGRILAGYALHLVAAGRDDAALEMADEALAALEPLLQANPEGLDLRRSSGNALTARARATARSGDPAGALADLERAADMNPSAQGAEEERALAPAWVALWSGDVATAVATAEAVAAGAEPASARRFSVARLLALAAAEAGEPTRADELAALALRHLRGIAEADALTPRRLVRLEHDPDFDALRGRPGLQALLGAPR